jgi:hypothetical protein
LLVRQRPDGAHAIWWIGARRISDDRQAAVPARQVRGLFTDETITVYQAYPPEIAPPSAGRLVFRGAVQARPDDVDQTVVWHVVASVRSSACP